MRGETSSKAGLPWMLRLVTVAWVISSPAHGSWAAPLGVLPSRSGAAARRCRQRTPRRQDHHCDLQVHGAPWAARIKVANFAGCAAASAVVTWCAALLDGRLGIWPCHRETGALRQRQVRQVVAHAGAVFRCDIESLEQPFEDGQLLLIALEHVFYPQVLHAPGHRRRSQPEMMARVTPCRRFDPWPSCTWGNRFFAAGAVVETAVRETRRPRRTPLGVSVQLFRCLSIDDATVNRSCILYPRASCLCPPPAGR